MQIRNIKRSPAVTMLFYWLRVVMCMSVCMYGIHVYGHMPDPGHNSLYRDESNRPRDGGKVVHVVFMNHLDVGYASYINNIINEYFYQYFPRAARLGRELRDGGYPETFKYTTHAWLVSLFLNCPPELVLNGVRVHCPNETEVTSFRKAVADGFITWHAGPANLQLENQNRWLLEAGLDIAKCLDNQLGIHRRFKVLSQRDVPGMSHAVIPSLVSAGIGAVTVGVNNMSPPPAVPRLFVWQYGKQEVLATWHPRGYPDDPGVDPAHPGGLSRDDCVEAGGHVLCFSFRSDNHGPPLNIEEVLNTYEIVRAEFPGAEIRASTLEDFFLHVNDIRDELPVVSQEIGDVWIGGIASDPRKNLEYRLVARELSLCADSGECNPMDERVWNASRMLTKLPEHTWGLAGHGDSISWRNEQLEKVINTAGFRRCANSWREQRSFTELAVAALGDLPVAKRIKQQLRQTTPSPPDLQHYQKTEAPGIFASVASYPKKYITMKVGKHGTITTLDYYMIPYNTQAVDLGKFVYVTYNETDIDRFSSQYNYIPGESAGFDKPNMTTNAHPESKEWTYTMETAYTNMNAPKDVWIQLLPDDVIATTYYGAPAEVWINYKPSMHSYGTPVFVDMTVLILNKTRTRLPEAMYVTFTPATEPGYSWWYSKLGHKVDPLNVVLNGSQYQHAVDDQGVFYTNQSGFGLQFQSPDVPVACPITPQMRNPTSFAAPLQPISDRLTGVGFNLYNNMWDTNYIYWYPYNQEDKDFKAKFRIQFNGL